jgi:hypothetical protein
MTLLAIINPAYVPMAKELGISTITASYQTTVVIALNGASFNVYANIRDGI